MMKPSRRVRSMIMRIFLGAMITNFVIFSLIAVLFSFSLEDDIFSLQVEEAVSQFLAQNPKPPETSGSFKTLDMIYYVGTDAMPLWLQEEIDPRHKDRSFEVFGGEHGHYHAYAHTLEDGEMLYVLFNARRFIRSTPEVKAFLVIIGVMAVLTAVICFFVLNRMSRKVSTPLEQMMAALSASKDEGTSVPLTIAKNAPRELHALSDALAVRDAHIQNLLDRERAFNRDASHELRTPLSVAFGAAEILEEKEGKSPALLRLMTAIKDMQQLTEGILWLGREASGHEACSLDEVCQDSIKSYRHLIGEKEIEVHYEESGAFMPVPKPVAQVIISNLLRNAFSYTDQGSVTVQANDAGVEILDTGVGFGQEGEEREGFGIGLSLVERLCEHFHIDFSVETRSEGGSRAKLSWDQAFDTDLT